MVLRVELWRLSIFIMKACSYFHARITHALIPDHLHAEIDPRSRIIEPSIHSSASFTTYVSKPCHAMMVMIVMTVVMVMVMVIIDFGVVFD